MDTTMTTFQNTPKSNKLVSSRILLYLCMLKTNMDMKFYVHKQRQIGIWNRQVYYMIIRE